MSERLLTEKSPGELRALVTGFLGSVPGAFIVLDKEWRLVYLNREAREIFLIDDASLIGRPLEEVYPRHFGHILAPKTIRGLIDGKENTVTRYVSEYSKWYKVSAYASDTGVFIRLEDITPEMAANRLLRLNQFSVNDAGDMVFWFKPGGHIIYANKASCNSLGFGKKELAGMTVADIDPYFRDNKWAMFVEDVKRKGSVVYESSLRACDRSIIPVEVTCSYLYYHGEEYLVAFARDIKKRKQAEEVIRINAVKQATAEKLANIGYWDWDITTNEVKWSDGHFHIFNYPVAHGSETYEMFRARVHPDDIDALENKLREGMEKDTGYKWDYRLVWPDGSVRHVQAEADRPVKDDSGRPVRWFGIVQDVTERKRIEDALRNAEEFNRATLDTLPANIAVLDDMGKIVFANRQWMEFGLENDVCQAESIGVGANYFDVCRQASGPHSDEARDALEGILAVLRGEMDGFELEYPCHSPDKKRWFLMRVTLIKTGTLRGIIVVHSDITRRKLSEEALAREKSWAELYNDLMGHDINNYNQVALGYLELLNDAVHDANIKELIAKPTEAIASSSRLIENVRKLQKAGTGRLKTQAMDLDKVLSELHAQYSEVPGKATTIRYTHDRDCVVLADGLVKDVFANLISNAIKHASSNMPTEVVIRLTKINDPGKKCCRVDIEDNGPGIPDAVKSKLFHRFQRGETQAHGKGLGLYLVRTLVENYHGKVWVEDRVKGDHSQGARFVVLLPAVDN